MKTRKIFFLVLLILISGCLQQGGAEVKPTPTLVPKKIVPVPYPEEAKTATNPIPATEESLAQGKAKYETFCSICHGKKGEARESVTREFEVDPSVLISDVVKKRTDGELFWVCSNGVNGTKMLPWKDVLSDEERWHVINYIRLLQKESG